MRINKLLAAAAGISRRAADAEITAGQVLYNGQPASPGLDVGPDDTIVHKGRRYRLDDAGADRPKTLLMLNKPAGYVVSRHGQGSLTIYELLPARYQRLQPVGRLDKDSSGLLLLTDDGQLANRLSHPRYQKLKLYEVGLDKPLQPLHRQMISDHGLQLDDGPSRLLLERLHDGDDRQWRVTMHEGRNRQIRRTFAALGYTVGRLHWTQFGDFILGGVATADWTDISDRLSDSEN